MPISGILFDDGPQLSYVSVGFNNSPMETNIQFIKDEIEFDDELIRRINSMIYGWINNIQSIKYYIYVYTIHQRYI